MDIQYCMKTEEGDNFQGKVADPSHDRLTRQWPDSIMDTPAYQVANVEGYTQELTCESPVLEAGKKDSYRVCVNYIPVNKVVLDSGYPIPNINFLFTLLEDARYFAVYDCLKGFGRLPLAEQLRDLSRFATSMGCFRWTRLPMGMKLSLLAWQAQVDALFFNEMLKTFICYIDDRLTISRTFEDHLVHVKSILQKAKKAGLSLSVSKCKFGYNQVKLLGYIVSRAGLQMDPVMK